MGEGEQHIDLGQGSALWRMRRDSADSYAQFGEETALDLTILSSAARTWFRIPLAPGW